MDNMPFIPYWCSSGKRPGYGICARLSSLMGRENMLYKRRQPPGRQKISDRVSSSSVLILPKNHFFHQNFNKVWNIFIQTLYVMAIAREKRTLSLISDPSSGTEQDVGVELPEKVFMLTSQYSIKDSVRHVLYISRLSMP
jgi:hypothetical protein